MRPLWVEKADAHILFNLTAANDGQLPMKTNIKLDTNFLGAECVKCWCPHFGGSNRVLNKK